MIFLGCNSSDGVSVRHAAVAGKFYPGSAPELRRDVEGYIGDGKPLGSYPKLLISPHAGFVFSGPVAGKGYATIDRKLRTVFIIGPSHYQWFEGISISDADCYETPLGKVLLDKEIIAKLRSNPLVTYEAGADGPEHCLEVQLPFLQVALESFKIVPIITGKVQPGEVAELLYRFIGDKVLVVGSSDLSHYHAQKEARGIDDRTIATVLSGKNDGFIDACGETVIRILMRLAEKMKLSPVLLDARTSYETMPEYGSSRVVGYASIAFINKDVNTSQDRNSSAEQSALKTAKEGKPASQPVPNDGDIPSGTKSFLLKLARTSLEASVKGEKIGEPRDLPAGVKENSGCFVTLTKGGQLRGCIGYIEPIKPLYKAVIDNARNAALEDPRFTQVTPDELGEIKVEVSVLTRPVQLEYNDPQDLLKKLVPEVDGIILQKGPFQSTFLPQVWEQLPDKIDFLEHLSMKGGMSRDGWKTANVKRYRAIHFQEQ